jgi:hypothetical protein
MSTSSNEEKHRQQVFAAMEETEKLQAKVNAAPADTPEEVTSTSSRAYSTDAPSSDTTDGAPWRKIVNKQHLIGLYEVLLKWRCSGPGGTPRTFK